MKIFAILILGLWFPIISYSQQHCWYRDDQSLQLSTEQQQALLWFCALGDSLKIDSVIQFSEVPFNWDDQATILDKKRLFKSLKKVWMPSIMIDTVFTAKDSSKVIYFSDDDRKFELIEIQFFVPNNLHTHVILVAVLPTEQKIIGFYSIGDVMRPRRPFIPPD